MLSIEFTISVVLSTNDLFDKVSVVARPTKVSELVGNVNVPVLMMVLMVGLVKVLFVKVCVAVNVPTVSVISGKVIVRLTVCTPANVRLVDAVAPDVWNPIVFVGVVLSTKNTEPFCNDLFVNVALVDCPTKVSVLVGKVNVPVFRIVPIIGLVNVLFNKVCVVANVTTVSVASGKVIVLLTVCIPAKVKDVAAVAPDVWNPIVFVAVVLSTKNTEPLTKLLLDKVSVVARPTKVSVLVGNVNVPVLTIVAIIGLVNVLLVRVSVVFLPTSVSELVGNVNVPTLTIDAMTGNVKVLLVNVSVVARPTKVSVLVGNVNVPLLIIVLMVGLVSVLFVRVSVVARPTSVSVAFGNVST